MENIQNNICSLPYGGCYRSAQIHSIKNPGKLFAWIFLFISLSKKGLSILPAKKIHYGFKNLFDAIICQKSYSCYLCSNNILKEHDPLNSFFVMQSKKII